MTHYMKLHKRPFTEISSGRKTIELRLLDEKRQLIRCGDDIIFTCSDDPQSSVKAQVLALHCYSNFETLYQTLPLEKCGYTSEELPSASSKDMEVYYSKDKQARYGVVGIELIVK